MLSYNSQTYSQIQPLQAAAPLPMSSNVPMHVIIAVTDSAKIPPEKPNYRRDLLFSSFPDASAKTVYATRMLELPVRSRTI